MNNRKLEKMKSRRLQLWDAAVQFELAHPGAASGVDPKLARRRKQVWHAFDRVDKRLYNYEQKKWTRQWRRISVAPYGMFSTIPTAMYMLVRRFYEYWQHGYNVKTADPDGAVKRSVEKAYELGTELMRIGDEFMEKDELSYADYVDKLKQFFQYVAQHCWEWGD